MLQPDENRGMPFLWPAGQSLAEALAFAKLTLDEKPLLAIQLVGLDADPCRFHETQGHLVA